MALFHLVLLFFIFSHIFFSSLFVAVLVDNFQRTLSATEKNKKAATKTVFQVKIRSLHIDMRTPPKNIYIAPPQSSDGFPTPPR
jgi:hypothetical protein